MFAREYFVCGNTWPTPTVETAFNLEIAESLMLAWFDIFGWLQAEGDPETNFALEQFRTWSTIFHTLERL